MVNTSPLPYLSVFNGPAYLLHAVEVLKALNVPAANVRLLPAIGHFAQTEVMPYRNRLVEEDVSAETVQPEDLAVRLGVNIRGDNRLWRFLTLTAVGLPPARALREWNKETMSLADWVRQWCTQQFQELRERIPDWTNHEAPAARLARQLHGQYPELREPEPPGERPADRVLIYRDGEVVEALNEYIRPKEELTEEERIVQWRVAQELVELFFTQVFLSIAGADLIGGFEFDHRIEPEGRQIGITVHGQSDIEDLARWVNAYPHHPKPEVSYEGLDDKERQVWEAYFRQQMERFRERPGQFKEPPENIFDTAVNRWTENDPGIEAMYQEIRAQYEAGRTDEMTPDEMLTLARKHLLDYIPYYPRQASVTGGLNLGGILLRLIEQWLDQGAFLGVTREDLEYFEPEEQMLLRALLLQRRAVTDYGSLFRTAVRLLVHPYIQVEMERFIHYPSVLGTPFAQPGRTMVLNGESVLHSPEAIVRIPFDRAEENSEEIAALIESKLDILRRLFVPVHIPIRYEWAVNWVNLERPTFPLSPTAAGQMGWSDTSGRLKTNARWVSLDDSIEVQK